MKKTVALLMALCIIFALTACGNSGGGGGSSPAGPTKETIKVGFIAPQTGISAPSGIDLRDGFALYLKQKDGLLGGHKIDVIYEDCTGDPGTAAQKARKLVEQDNVSILSGTARTPDSYAIAEYSMPIKMPLILNGSTGDAHTKQNYNEYVFRVGLSASQCMFPLADYAYNVLGYRRIATMAMDNGFGHETVAAFQYEFERLGGKIVARVWNPNACLDFAPYLAQLPTDVDAVVVTQAGGDGLNFYPAYKAYGLTMPLLASGSSTDESLLPGIGAPAIGTISSSHFSAALDTPLMKSFVADFKETYGRVPGFNAEVGYATGAIMDGLFDLMPGAFDIDILMNNFKGFEAVWARGPIKIDQYNHPTENFYIREVREVNGELQNVVIHTYEMVSQFWVFNAEEMIALPPFGKDFPAFVG